MKGRRRGNESLSFSTVEEIRDSSPRLLQTRNEPAANSCGWQRDVPCLLRFPEPAEFVNNFGINGVDCY